MLGGVRPLCFFVNHCHLPLTVQSSMVLPKFGLILIPTVILSVSWRCLWLAIKQKGWTRPACLIHRCNWRLRNGLPGCIRPLRNRVVRRSWHWEIEWSEAWEISLIIDTFHWLSSCYVISTLTSKTLVLFQLSRTHQKPQNPKNVSTILIIICIHCLT